jgi:hypothetical protein
MGTNYYRIPKAEEMEAKKKLLIQQVTDLDLSVYNIECDFHKPIDDQWDCEYPFG